MNKQEFESLTKSNVSDQLFEEWNRVYMAAGEEIDKVIFCKAIKATKGNAELTNLLMSLRNRVESLTVRIENREHTIEQIREEAKELQELYDDLERANMSYDSELKEKDGLLFDLIKCLLRNNMDEQAIEIVGHAKVIAAKASSGMEFNDKDREYITFVFSMTRVNP